MSFAAHTSVNTRTLDRAREMASRAEHRRFAEIDFTDSAHEPFLPCVSAIEATDRIRVGTSVAIAFSRSPMVTAMTAWDLQRHSSGRFVLGLGSQVKAHNERRFSIPWSPPAPRLREYVLALRAIWHSFQTGDRLAFEGKHYNFSLMTPNFNPGPIDHPDIPVHLAALNPVSARVAAEVANGIKLHPFHTASYLREVILPAIEEGLATSGKTRDNFEICGGGLIALGNNEAELAAAKAQVRHWLAFYGSTPGYRGPLGERWSDLGDELHRMSRDGQWEQMASRIPDELVHEFAIVSTYEGFAAAIKERYAGLIDVVTFPEDFNGPEAEEAMVQIVKELKAG